MSVHSFGSTAPGGWPVSWVLAGAFAGVLAAQDDAVTVKPRNSGAAMAKRRNVEPQIGISVLQRI